MKGIFRSRSRVFLLTIALLALLDLGRSLYARMGYAQPVEAWQPDPKVYADIAWPPGSDLPANAPAGQRIYAQHCQVCHGPDGRGNGPAAPSLIPRPRDFTLGQFKYKSTAPDQPPSDADLFRVVRDGLHASAMPYWKDLLSDTEIREVVAYVKSFRPHSTARHRPSSRSRRTSLRTRIALSVGEICSARRVVTAATATMGAAA